MTQISISDVHHLAQLSSLQLDEAEAQALKVDLEDIIGYINHLSEIDTTGVEPTYQVTDLQNVWRDDEVDTYGIDAAQLVSLAAESEHGQIKVPKVL